MTKTLDRKAFQAAILEGIPRTLPEPKPIDPQLSHAPKRKDMLTIEQKKLAVRNALRYFAPEHHAILAPEFRDELQRFGRIYMHRFRPDYSLEAHSIDDYPQRSRQAAAIMLMIHNNLDAAVAQFPDELITYGGNGSVFQNWAQYRLSMRYLAEMTDEQTLVLYSGHPLGLFPSHRKAPRAVVTNGLMVPNYSSPDDWERFNALGVTQYGQMTAGSFMYIGPQGIVHGTTITLLNAGRFQSPGATTLPGKLFVTSGLGGMSGAQGKAAVIAGAVGVIAEVDPRAIEKRRSQGWVDEVFTDLGKLLQRIEKARGAKEAVALAYHGNIVTLWEKLAQENIKVDLGSDQTSLHAPWSGGYYPVDLSFDESQKLISSDPARFRKAVEASLKRQVEAINTLTKRGMYFWDYGNAFLLEAGRAGADVFSSNEKFRYPSYVEDIMGPLCFDYGFGPFRWICSSNDPKDLEVSDRIAASVLQELLRSAPSEISHQLQDNLTWIEQAQKNRLVVGAQSRILYADAQGRAQIAEAFNSAIREGKISKPIILGRDHHDVSGTDSPFRETADIRDGSKFTADMAVQNVIGDSFRGATWVSLHNGGGVGWGEVMNGGFGLLLDGTDEAQRRLRSMIPWDVTNGIARRGWARNKGAISTIERAMKLDTNLQVTVPNLAADDLIDALF